MVFISWYCPALHVKTKHTFVCNRGGKGESSHGENGSNDGNELHFEYSNESLAGLREFEKSIVRSPGDKGMYYSWRN